MFPSPRPSTQSRCKVRFQPSLLPCPSTARLQPASPHSLCTSTGLPVSPICVETPESESQRNHLSGGQARSILLDTGGFGLSGAVLQPDHRREGAGLRCGAHGESQAVRDLGSMIFLTPRVGSPAPLITVHPPGLGREWGRQVGKEVPYR